ncbi:hypothetical protein ACN082_09770 [Rothia sp. CCM 9417]|uniref:hypothetical protein n=1 Tax=Rothia sp. CCM 9417 TaxID=3402657 RepID=UPI003ADFEC8C
MSLRADPLAWVYGVLEGKVRPAIYSQVQQGMPNEFVLINAITNSPDRQAGYRHGFHLLASFTSVAPNDADAYDNCQRVINRLLDAFNNDEQAGGLYASMVEPDNLPTQSPRITAIERRDIFQYTFTIDFYFELPD